VNWDEFKDSFQLVISSLYSHLHVHTRPSVSMMWLMCCGTASGDYHASQNIKHAVLSQFGRFERAPARAVKLSLTYLTPIHTADSSATKQTVADWFHTARQRTFAVSWRRRCEFLEKGTDPSRWRIEEDEVGGGVKPPWLDRRKFFHHVI